MSDLIARIQGRVRTPATRTDQTQLGAPELWPVATAEQIDETERRLGHRFPPLLAEVYTTIGNGGFGPGYGMMGIVGGVPGDGGDRTAIDLYDVFRGGDPEDPAWKWPAGLLPVCDWGCAIRSCVDCTSPEGPVWTFDPNPRGINEPLEKSIAQTHDSLAGWLEDWRAGVKLWDVMFEDDPEGAVTGINPRTREPYTFQKTRLRRR